MKSLDSSASYLLGALLGSMTPNNDVDPDEVLARVAICLARYGTPKNAVEAATSLIYAVIGTESENKAIKYQYRSKARMMSALKIQFQCLNTGDLARGIADAQAAAKRLLDLEKMYNDLDDKVVSLWEEAHEEVYGTSISEIKEWAEKQFASHPAFIITTGSEQVREGVLDRCNVANRSC